MSVDYAELGFRFESTEAEVAAQRLKRLGKAANEAETAAMRLSRQAVVTGKKMQQMGRSMTMYMTTPLLALGAVAVKSFASFDDAMTSSMAIMGNLSDAMRKEMSVAAREMGKQTVFSATQAAESYYFLASAGLSAAAAVKALPVVAAFAQAGNFDMARATDILTDAQSALGKVMKDPIENMQEMVKLSDVLVKANTVANASVQQFGEALTNKAGTAMKQLNIDVTEGVAVLAAWADQGIKSTEAGEKFNIVTRDLQTAFRNNTKEFKQYGIEVFTAQGEMRNLGDIIQNLESVLGPMSVQQQGATLVLLGFQDRSVIAIRSLLGLSANIKKYEDALKSAGGITDEVANKQMESFANQLKKMKGEINDVAIEIGATLAPSVLVIAQSFRDLANDFKALPPETQNNILKILALTAAIGPLVFILGGLIRAIGYLIPIFVRLGIAMGPASALYIGFGLLIKAIGEAYVKSIERAILNTTRFQAVLEGLELKGLTMNLMSVNETIDSYINKIKEQQQAVEQARNAADISGVDTEYNQQLEALAQLRKELEDLIKLRDNYTVRVRNATIAEQETANVLAEVIVLAERLEEIKFQPLTLSEDEVDDLKALKAELDPAADAMEKLVKARQLLAKALKTKDISPAVYEKLAHALERSAVAFEAFGEAAFRLREFNQTIKTNLEDNMAFVDGLEAAENAFNALERSLIPSIGALQDWQDMYNEAFQAYVDGDIDPERWERLQKALAKAEFAASAWGDSFEEAARGWMTTLESLRDSYDEESRQAQMLNSVIQILNVAMGIQAVIKQLAGGDVWSAIPRALAVAGMIASMGVSTGASGSAVAERTRQETQGTGTVLGDAEAKSESILNATEITADATSELVGINRGMLHALQNLETGLGGASVQLARGSGDIDFGEMPNTDIKLFNMFDPIGLNFVGDFLNKLFGGKSKLLDYGIQIMGGFLNDLTTDVMVQAWQQVSVKKWVFGSTKIKDRFQGLDDEVATQFALVFTSIRDTVTEAALALGVPLADIEARIAQFQIATTSISFQDLNAEEQREELLAVFGAIFDDLAGDVVPFIGQFQKVGEGLGETLVRVATSVQVFREAVDALGFVIDTADPELFAQIAVGLVELTGGVENFISMFTTFFDLFASEEQKLEFITNQVTRAFEGVGLTIPKTRDAVFDLMMTLDATTEEGRRQIAMLLELAPVLDEYYSLMEEGTNDLANQAREFADIVAAFIGIGDSSQLRALKNSFNEAMDAAKALNATQKEYAMITRAFNMQLKRMAAELTLSVLSLVQQLFGEDSTYGDPINEGLQETNEVANSVFSEWQRALEDIYDYTQQLLLDENLTTLTPAEQLSEAQAQFNDILAKARAGDVDAAAALPKAAQALLEEARFMFASGEKYTDIFDMVLAALNSVKIPSGVPEFIKEEENKNAGIVDPIVTAIDEQTKALQRYLQALDLAATLRDLSRVLNVSVISLAQELGVPLRELAQILGVNLTPIDNTTAEAIGDLAVSLGADIYELLDALGVDLFALAKVSGVHIDEMSADLVAALGDFAEALGVDVLKLIDKMGIPIAELAKTFGIGIDQFSAEQFKALVAFSASLGAGITDVAEALNINLGDIRDATSILSQALGIAIGELPPDIQVGLGPYLEAIRTATNDADANGAIDDLGKYVLSLPPDIAAPLIPFLDAMGFENIAPELATLFDIEKNTRLTAEALLGKDIDKLGKEVLPPPKKDPYIRPYIKPIDRDKPPPVKNYLDPIKYDPYKKGFATGGYVGQTGLHQLHAGEFVINKSANNVSPVQDNELTVAELSQIRTVLSDIRDQQRRYQEADLASSRNIESSMKQQAEQTRRASNG